jgi:hypothetical protein
MKLLFAGWLHHHHHHHQLVSVCFCFSSLCLGDADVFPSRVLAVMLFGFLVLAVF